MAHVILDKSYLDAANKDEIKSLCDNHTVLMPDVLFHELITTKEESMRRCFDKFPNRRNPVELIPNVGTLLINELSKHQSCCPLYDQRLKIDFAFNEKLRNGSFKFTDGQVEAIRNRENQVEEDKKAFFELAMLVLGFFSTVKALPFKEFSDAIEKAKTQIANDPNKVKEVYQSFLAYGAPPNPVRAECINENWAYFRWIQVRVLYSLDLLLKYQDNLPKNPGTNFWRRIEHDLLDSEYVILASLTRALASNENRMTSFFMSVCPKGEIFRINR